MEGPSFASIVITEMTSLSNSTLPPAPESTGNENAPILDISNDERLSLFVEVQAAKWIDNIYVPFCAGLGILGNTLSFFVLMSPRMSGTSTSVYIAALALSDSLVQVCNLLFWVRKFPGVETLTHGTCGLVLFLFFFSIHYSVVVMMGMTAERYLAIRFPLKAGHWCTPRRAKVGVVGMSVLVTAVNMHNLIIRKMVWNDALKTYSCSPDSPESQFFLSKVWPWVDGGMYCYVPLLTVAVLNVLIVRQMRAAQKFRGSSGSATDGSNVSRQVTVMLLMVTGTFLLCVAPIAVMLVLEQYVWLPDTPHQQAIFHLVRTVLNQLVYTNHAVNFILYCLSGNRFRQEFMRTFLPCLLDKAGDVKGKPTISTETNATIAKETSVSAISGGSVM